MLSAIFRSILGKCGKHSAIVVFTILVCSGLNAMAATTRLGPSYMPPGADYIIFSIQGIDTSHMFGDGSSLSQVNTDFEFTGGIGVTYDPGNGTLKDFGIGLYKNTMNQVKSTGLRIQLAAPTDAAKLTITWADFDLDPKKDKFFDPGKVAPRIILFGPGGSVYATAGPSDIFNLMTVNTTSPVAMGKKAPDVWDLNFGALLASLHLADTNITGYQLYADAGGGNKVPSDPYFFVSQTVTSP